MPAALPTDGGTYVLVMSCRKTARIRIGRLGILALLPGYYLYVGSAQGPGGLRARVARHRRRLKKMHWHVDYLRPHTMLIETWTRTGPSREHDWAAALGAYYPVAMNGFGASDCRCRAHLFRSTDRPGPRDLDDGLRFRIC